MGCRNFQNPLFLVEKKGLLRRGVSGDATGSETGASIIGQACWLLFPHWRDQLSHSCRHCTAHQQFDVSDIPNYWCGPLFPQLRRLAFIWSSSLILFAAITTASVVSASAASTLWPLLVWARCSWPCRSTPCKQSREKHFTDYWCGPLFLL